MPRRCVGGTRCRGWDGGTHRPGVPKKIFVEAVKRVGSLDNEKIREAILRMNLNTVRGAFKVGRGGFQIVHKMVVFQWQDGKRVIVWPEELAPNQPRFPTPPWSQRP